MLRPGHVVALAALALLTLGVVMVNSAGMTVPPAPPPAGEPVVGDPARAQGLTAQSIIFSRSTLYMALALGAMGVAAVLPIRVLARRSMALAGDGRGPAAGLWVLALGTLALLVVCALVYVPGLASPRKGSHRWIEIPGLGEQTLQPSEIAKWGLVALAAWVAAARHRFMDEFWRGFVPVVAAVGAVSAFIVVEDLGTGVLIGAASCVVLIAGGNRIWHYLVLLPAALAGIAAAIYTSEYRTQRILAFLNPYEHPEGIGYHALQSLIAVAGGAGPGRGLGYGLQKFGYLPEDRTDFLFAIICEELGIAGAGLVVGLFALILISGLAILRREREPMLRLWGLGILATLGMQALMNLAVVTAMAPTKGIALPLLSSGGTGWILTAFSLGILIAIDRTQPEASPADLPPGSFSGGPSLPPAVGGPPGPPLQPA